MQDSIPPELKSKNPGEPENSGSAPAMCQIIWHHLAEPALPTCDKVPNSASECIPFIS